ncbi:MAG: YciI family protein [Rhodanobacter sp.]
MKFRVMIYANNRPLDVRPGITFNRRTHGSLIRPNMPRAQALSLGSRPLAPAGPASCVRVREGQTSVVDGPCAGNTECLIDCNLIEAADMEEAVLMASCRACARTGVIEVRPVRAIKLMRQRTGI